MSDFYLVELLNTIASTGELQGKLDKLIEGLIKTSVDEENLKQLQISGNVIAVTKEIAAMTENADGLNVVPGPGATH